MPKRIAPKKRHLSPHFLRKWRLKRKLSLDQVVEKLKEIEIDCSKASLSRVETQQQAFTQDILDGLSIVYKCTRVELLERDPGDPRGVRAVLDQMLNSPSE